MLKILFVETPVDLAYFTHGKGDMYSNAGYYVLSHWVGALTAYLKKKSPLPKIKVLDRRYGDLRGIKNEIQSFNPDFVGLSPKFLSYSNTLKIARLSKKLGAKVILGGCHATHLRKEILQNRGPGSSDYCIDAIIQYDGEKALYEYIKGKDPSKINNLVYLNKGKVKENPIELLDLDSLPIPDFEPYGLRKIDLEKKIFLVPVLSQLGCSWRVRSGGCIFCVHTYPNLRFKNPKIFLREIHFFNQNYQHSLIFDTAEEFFNDFGWFEKFYQFSFGYSLRPRIRVYVSLDRINEKIAKMLRDLNLDVLVGVESNSPQSLTLTNKGVTALQNRKATDILEKYDIGGYYSFLLGAPKESKKTIKETASFIKEISHKKNTKAIMIQSLIPFPGSRAWQILKGKIGDKYQGKDLIDWNEARKDWIKNFCDISTKEFHQALKSLRERFLMIKE